MFIEAVIITLVALLSYKLFYYLRYDFALLPLYGVALLQGRNVKVARTQKEIKEAFTSSDKGTVLEELLATPAWSPILSIESVNGSLWQTLKRNFLLVQKLLPSKIELGKIAEVETKRFLDEAGGNRMNSKDISKLTLKIFTEWIFKDTVFEYPDQTFNSLSDEMIERIYLSNAEYKKEIALKGKGCRKLKQDSINLMVDLLSHNSKYKDVFTDWSAPIHYSVVMQPLIISPMINVADIAVNVQQQWHLYQQNGKNIDQFIDLCIQSAHPFPMLERYDKSTNTQIFIDLNSLEESEKNIAFNYSLGPRACIGRHYAREFLGKFFGVIVERKGIEFVPLEQHKYSGRNNDNGEFTESVYQLKLVFNMFYKLIKNKLREEFMTKVA